MGMRWLLDNRQAGSDFLMNEMQIKPQLARRGWEYYVEKRVWDRDMQVNVDGIKTIIRIYNEMSPSKSTAVNPDKYLDGSYLKEALRGDK